MRLNGRTLWIRGRPVEIEVKQFAAGDGEGFTNGYWIREERQIGVDKHAQDSSTLMHEVAHVLADDTGTYLSEFQVAVLEEFWIVCRDPRNRWLREYLFGE